MINGYSLGSRCIMIWIEVLWMVCKFPIKVLMINQHHDSYIMFVGLRPVIQILCHVLARGWGHWPRYFTKAKVEVKYGSTVWIPGPKHDTRFEWPVSIQIMTQYPFLPFKTHKTSAKILVYLWSLAPFDFAVTASARPPNFECMHLLLRSTDWWRHNILF